MKQSLSEHAERFDEKAVKRLHDQVGVIACESRGDPQ